jgi:tetratricopeptide (TPR) repeat protein
MVDGMSAFITYALGVIGSISAIVLISWFVTYRLKRSEDPGAVVVRWLITLGAISLWVYLGKQTQHTDPITTFFYVCVAALSAVFLGALWAPSIGEFLATPFTRLYDGGDEQPELRPFYSIASGYRKRGRYDQAILEIRKQLARFPEDFEGWMMLAEVQAQDLNDLPAAADTVENVLALPKLPARNFAVALTRLGDWHLELGDRDAARSAFERIIEKLPDTEDAHFAAQRIAHLASAEHIAEMQAPRVLIVKPTDQRLGLRRETVAPPPGEDPATTANRYVEHLREHPLDNEAREKLALLYATEMRRLDLASAELEQLIATPNQTPKHIAHWLNMLADLHIRLANDVERARETLQRIIDRDPKSAVANNARVRMSQLRLELNQNNAQRTLKLGNYEQNIGLKRVTSAGPAANEP